MACKCCRYYMWKLVHQIKALTIKWHWCVGEAFNCETIDWSKMNFWHNVSFKINQISNTLLSTIDIIDRNRKINVYICFSILFTNNFTAITYYHMMLVIMICCYAKVAFIFLHIKVALDFIISEECHILRDRFRVVCNSFI